MGYRTCRVEGLCTESPSKQNYSPQGRLGHRTFAACVQGRNREIFRGVGGGKSLFPIFFRRDFRNFDGRNFHFGRPRKKKSSAFFSPFPLTFSIFLLHFSFFLLFLIFLLPFSIFCQFLLHFPFFTLFSCLIFNRPSRQTKISRWKVGGGGGGGHSVPLFPPPPPPVTPLAV